MKSFKCSEHIRVFSKISKLEKPEDSPFIFTLAEFRSSFGLDVLEEISETSTCLKQFLIQAACVDNFENDRRDRSWNARGQRNAQLQQEAKLRGKFFQIDTKQ